MRSLMLRWLGATVAAGALTFAGALPGYAQTATMAEAIEGVPGAPLVFYATGFQDSEQASYWINTPNGAIISTAPLAKTDDSGNTTTPLLTQANVDGDVMINWSAPASAAAGSYSLVIYGLTSDHQQVIAFMINPSGSQTVTQDGVAPAAGPAGTVFIFHAAGFLGSTDVDGEQASYWVNTPDGSVISTKPLIKDNSEDNTTTPLVAQAGADGIVKIFWSGPADVQPGSYSLVVHGLVSQREVVIAFTIQ